MRVDKKGDWSLVTPQSVQAFLYDKNGTLLRTVALDEKGGFFSGLLSAPDAQGSYEVFIQATGTFNGAGFTRVEFETMNVLGTSRLFTGAFADFPSDSDGDGKYDSIVFSCSAALPSAGYHTVAADLYDSRGNFVSHSSASLEADSQGTKSFDLPFDLGGVHCGQFSGKFMVSGLKILDGDDLRPLDVWNEEISTGLYQAGTFDCSSAPLSPVISNIAPSKVTVGTAVNIAITGKNFDEGATLVFDQSISVVGSQRYDNRVFFATISVSGSSAPGFRDVKIINPDGRSGILKDVLLVAADTPPMVSFESPSDGSVVSGTVNVTANAVDDVKIESVSFALDGAHQATVSAFPFIWSWNSGASGLGTHVVSATAVDSSGKETARSRRVGRQGSSDNIGLQKGRPLQVRRFRRQPPAGRVGLYKRRPVDQCQVEEQRKDRHKRRAGPQGESSEGYAGHSEHRQSRRREPEHCLEMVTRIFLRYTGGGACPRLFFSAPQARYVMFPRRIWRRREASSALLSPLHPFPIRSSAAPVSGLFQ